MEEHIGERINVHRSKELAEANTSQVGANCPFCITMISDGMKDEAVGKEDVTVRDLAEIVADCLPDPEPAAAPEPAADEGEAGSA